MVGIIMLLTSYYFLLYLGVIAMSARFNSSMVEMECLLHTFRDLEFFGSIVSENGEAIR